MTKSFPWAGIPGTGFLKHMPSPTVDVAGAGDQQSRLDKSGMTARQAFGGLE
jgi:hypothetical protein